MPAGATTAFTSRTPPPSASGSACPGHRQSVATAERGPFREGRENAWLQTFATAAARGADLASTYLVSVQELQTSWRAQLAELGVRADAAAWRVIDELPAQPIISIPVAVTATGRAKAAVQHAFEQLVQADVLQPLSKGQCNRQWEAVGLLDLASDVESEPAR